MPGAGLILPPARDARSALYPYNLCGGDSDDDEFDNEAFSGWTAVQDSSPVLTLTEGADKLSIYHPGGDSSAEFHAWVKARSLSAGDYVEACFGLAGKQQNFQIAGLIFADGNTYGAGSQFACYWSPTEGHVRVSQHTNYSSSGANAGDQVGAHHSPMFLRLVYNGSNSYSSYLSPDGISWAKHRDDTSTSWTPTHCGFFVTTWGGSTPCAFTFHYVRFYNAP